jgi:hypothetical protein
MLFLALIDFVLLFSLGLFAIWAVAALMLVYWKITAGIVLLMIILVCIAEPRVLYAGAIAIVGGWLLSKILVPVTQFLFDRNKKT